MGQCALPLYVGIGHSDVLPATFTDMTGALDMHSAKVKRLVLAYRTIQQNAYILRVKQGGLRAMGHSMAGNMSEAAWPRPAE